VFVRIAALVLTAVVAASAAPVRLDESDRTAFRHWFTFLADAAFERPPLEVNDCASLVRYAYREALRVHSPEWYRRARLPLVVSFPDVRQVLPVENGAWLLFKVSNRPTYAEFADAATLARHNARLISRDPHAARPGDLLYFHQDGAVSPDHLMIVVGESRFDADRRDWIVYHTGPQDDGPGEIRKVTLSDLGRHPAAHWRPVDTNPAFIGVVRLAILDLAS
jgi:uncharacterized protein